MSIREIRLAAEAVHSPCRRETLAALTTSLGVRLTYDVGTSTPHPHKVVVRQRWCQCKRGGPPPRAPRKVHFDAVRPIITPDGTLASAGFVESDPCPELRESVRP